VEDKPRSHLAVTPAALASLENKVVERTGGPIEALRPLVLMHPAAAFATKTWAAENFAAVADALAEQGLSVAAAAGPGEEEVLERLKASTAAKVHTFAGLSLPEITALASKAALFVGNDSGLAHIAAALDVPSVVIFGSSNRDHWRPWTSAPNEIVFEPFDCQPCPGYECRRFGTPRCIQALTPDQVIEAARNVLTAAGLPQS
jgi:ADP-heptose:LPS heptosyltransferase